RHAGTRPARRRRPADRLARARELALAAPRCRGRAGAACALVLRGAGERLPLARVRRRAPDPAVSTSDRARLVGINHVALEVDDIGAALDFYGRLFEFGLRSRGDRAAFIDIGDQFLALMHERGNGPDRTRHFGLVVDDKETARRALQAA